MPVHHHLRPFHAAIGALAVAGGLLLTGCGGDPDIGDVQDKLAEEAPGELQGALPGVEFDGDSVACPDGQSVAEGEEFDCTITGVEGGQDVTYTLSVTMTGEDSFSYRPTNVEVEGGGTTTGG